jgi:hypothetical protein
MAKLVDATDLKKLSGGHGNGPLNPAKFGEPPGLKARGNAEPIQPQLGWQV